MKSKFILSGLMGLLFVFTIGSSIASAQNFTGTWAIDKSRSTDLPPATEISMSIVQGGSKVTVSQSFVSSNGQENFKDTFVLNGKAQQVMLDGPNKTRAKGKRMARKIDGGFESVDEGAFNLQGMPQPITVKTERKWQLSPDGRTMTLEITRTTGMGTRQSRRVFTKR